MSNSDINQFSALGLSDPVVEAVIEIGYETPSAIQKAAIGALLEGRDILGQAQTGTGKTAAFALPLLSRLDLAQVRAQILVLTPTRELAIQVAEAFQNYARHLPGFHVLPVYGGQSLAVQLRPLRRGVHAVVGTPGRILDHLRRGTLVLKHLRAVVLDEADEMLRMGFIDDVGSILDKTPKDKQLALFSATLPEPIRAIARKHTRDPLEIKIESPTATVSTVAQRYWQVTGVHKLDALTRILEVEDFDAMLIFVRTKTTTVELAQRLEARGLFCAALNGDMNQTAREQTIDRLRKGRLDILIATDVAARGLDVDRISHVVNYDIPHDTESYVHRIGRTARAGHHGEAILFVAPRERRMLRAIEKATGQVITPMSIPSHEDVVDKRMARFKAKMHDVIESQDLTAFEAVISSYQAEHNVELGQIAAALAYMAQGSGAAAETKPEKKTPRKKSEFAIAPAKRTQSGRVESERPKPEKATRLDERPGKNFDGKFDRKSERHSENKRQKPGKVAGDKVLYRIEVGALHGVEPKNIVGAIASEAGLDGRLIGAIEIREDHATVELPGGMPKEIFKHLAQVRICGQSLRISALSDPSARSARVVDRKHSSPGLTEGKPPKRKEKLKEKTPKRKPKKRDRNQKDKGKRRAPV